MQDLLWWSLYKAEPLLENSSMRSRALQEAMRHIHYEVTHSFDPPSSTQKLSFRVKLSEWKTMGSLSFLEACRTFIVHEHALLSAQKAF